MFTSYIINIYSVAAINNSPSQLLSASTCMKDVLGRSTVVSSLLMLRDFSGHLWQTQLHSHYWIVNLTYAYCVNI